MCIRCRVYLLFFNFYDILLQLTSPASITGENSLSLSRNLPPSACTHTHHHPCYTFPSSIISCLSHARRMQGEQGASDVTLPEWDQLGAQRPYFFPLSLPRPPYPLAGRGWMDGRVGVCVGACKKPSKPPPDTSQPVSIWTVTCR